jgi:hypothetical protein
MMGLNQRSTDRKPDAHTAGTGAEERIKHADQIVRIDALAVIDHGKLNRAGIYSLGLHNQRWISRLRRRDGIEGVPCQVDQDLLDLDRIAPDPRQIGCQN